MKKFAAVLFCLALTLGFSAEAFAGGFGVSVARNRNHFANIGNFSTRPFFVQSFSHRPQVFVSRNSAFVGHTPLGFNAFGVSTVIDGRGNVFEVDAFGNTQIRRFGVRNFNAFAAPSCNGFNCR